MGYCNQKGYKISFCRLGHIILCKLMLYCAKLSSFKCVKLYADTNVTNKHGLIQCIYIPHNIQHKLQNYYLWSLYIVPDCSSIIATDKVAGV